MPRLLDVADVVIGLPAALLGRATTTPSGGPTLAILDPIGDLPYARRLAVEARRMGHGSRRAATPQAVYSALEQAIGLLVVSAHVRPGRPMSQRQPRSFSATVTAASTNSGSASLAPAAHPLSAYPGVRRVVGDEWTGLTTGLMWAGASWVITSTWPSLEDRHTAASDAALVAAVHRLGPREVLWSWQRQLLRAWRKTPGNRRCSPYRWAGMILCGRGSATVA